jgi:hypothetical protein
MGGACSTYGGRGEAYTGFWWGNLRERDQLRDPGVDGRRILTFWNRNFTFKFYHTLYVKCE